MPRVLVTVPEKTPQPYRFELDSQRVTMGRGSKNDIVMESESVSVMHAEMRRVPGGFELVDLESTNGIQFDGQHFEVVSLQSGMILELGQVTFEFQLGDEETEALQLESRALNASTNEDDPSTKPAAIKPVIRPMPPRSKAPTSDSGIGAGAVFWFLVLATVAFGIGMAVRFERDTGASLIKTLMLRAAQSESGSKPLQ